jgi:transcriptional regulator with XRE-family HTH domain
MPPPSMPRQRLARLVVRYRRHAGLTQRQLATRLGVSAGAVASWEGARAWPDERQLLALIEECRLNPSELFDVRPPRRQRRTAYP